MNYFHKNKLSREQEIFFLFYLLFLINNEVNFITYLLFMYCYVGAAYFFDVIKYEIITVKIYT